MSRRTESVAVRKLLYAVSAETMVKEDKFYFQRFYRDDRVRLRGSKDRVIGTVIRAAVVDEGGVIVEWDNRSGELHLHNPRHLETVWLDDEGREV